MLIFCLFSCNIDCEYKAAEDELRKCGFSILGNKVYLSVPVQMDLFETANIQQVKQIIQNLVLFCQDQPIQGGRGRRERRLIVGAGHRCGPRHRGGGTRGCSVRCCGTYQFRLPRTNSCWLSCRKPEGQFCSAAICALRAVFHRNPATSELFLSFVP